MGGAAFKASGWLGFPEVARLRRADHRWKCPFIGVKRSCWSRARNDANDPIRTFIETFIPIFGMRSLDGSHQGIRQCY